MLGISPLNPKFTPILNWLLSASEPWVVYNTQLDLVGADPTAAATQVAYEALRNHPAVVKMIDSLADWPPAKPLSRAYDPKDTIWKLATLGDFGLRRDDERIAAIAEKVFVAQAEEGGFLHGGFDHTKSWHTRPYICISHVITYALARFGSLEDARLQHAYDHIIAWQRLDGGWHPNKLNLPGNERETDPSCPFGTLNVLRALVAHPDLRQTLAAQRAANYLLTCWERRAEPFRPVGFGIGSTWDKVQYPFVQYQLLKMADTLAQIPNIRQDQRLRQIIERLKEKQSSAGPWLAESTNKPYEDFDFGQKKFTSPWISFLALRAIHRTAE
ncbi:MAG: hypothetical protein EXR62_12645 [Chloroflexi bacterium]|nr:hypothetical protein [Chloroflexota bacterium]